MSVRGHETYIDQIGMPDAAGDFRARKLRERAPVAVELASADLHDQQVVGLRTHFREVPDSVLWGPAADLEMWTVMASGRELRRIATFNARKEVSARARLATRDRRRSVEGYPMLDSSFQESSIDGGAYSQNPLPPIGTSQRQATDSTRRGATSGSLGDARATAIDLAGSAANPMHRSRNDRIPYGQNRGSVQFTGSVSSNQGFPGDSGEPTDGGVPPHWEARQSGYDVGSGGRLQPLDGFTSSRMDRSSLLGSQLGSSGPNPFAPTDKGGLGIGVSYLPGDSSNAVSSGLRNASNEASLGPGSRRRLRRGFTTPGAAIAPVRDTLASADAAPKVSEDDDFCENVCSSIRSPGLQGASDADFKAVADSTCGMLAVLDVGRCGGISDIGLRAVALACPRITELDVSGCTKLSGPGLGAIADNCKQLEILRMSQLPRLDTWVCKRIGLSCSRLRVLDVSEVTALNDDSLGFMVHRCGQLQELSVARCAQVTDAGIISVANACPLLEALDLSRRPHDAAYAITDTCLMQVGARCGRLKKLDISGCENVSDVGLQYIGEGCEELESLKAKGCGMVADAGLRAVSEHCAGLREAVLSGCRRLTDLGLRALAQGCRELRALDLGGLFLLTDGREARADRTIRGRNHGTGGQRTGATGRRGGQGRHASRGVRKVERKRRADGTGVAVPGDQRVRRGRGPDPLPPPPRSILLAGASLLTAAQGRPLVRSESKDSASPLPDLVGGAGSRLGPSASRGTAASRGMASGGRGWTADELEHTLRTKAGAGLTEALVSTRSRAIAGPGTSGGRYGVLAPPLPVPPEVTGLRAFAFAHCPLRTLNLGGCQQLGDASLEPLCRSAGATITSLCISSCGNLTPRGLATVLPMMPRLRKLVASDLPAAVTDSVLQVVGEAATREQACHRLAHVDLSRCTGARDPGIAALTRGCLALEHLILDGCTRLTDLSMFSVAERNFKPGLLELRIAGIPSISDTGVSWIAMRCSQLLWLQLKGCSVSMPGLKAMSAGFRNTKIRSDDRWFGVVPTGDALLRRRIDEYGVGWMAALKLQSIVRGRRARQGARKARLQLAGTRAVVQLQTKWRGVLARWRVAWMREDRDRRRWASTVIQSFWRMCLGREELARRRVWQQEHRLHEVATAMQALWRGHSTRRFVRETRRNASRMKILKHESASLIQRVWRGVLGRRTFAVYAARVRSMRVRQDQGVRELQRVVRGRAARRRVARMRRRHVEEAAILSTAALRLQTKYRSHLAKRIRRRLALDKEVQNDAATCIQASWRARSGRLASHMLRVARRGRAEESAALMVQRAWRGKQGRFAAFLLSRARAVRDDQIVDAARFVQRVWRGHSGRKAAAERRLAMVREMLKQRDVFMWAAVTIQRLWRGVLGRRRARAVREEKASRWVRLTVAEVQGRNEKEDWDGSYLGGSGIDEDGEREVWFDRNSGEVRKRAPGAVLDLLPRPQCENCEERSAWFECRQCREYYCEQCFPVVHAGGRRAKHDFRPLLDFYGHRVDYGDGDWPAVWPSEIEQDEERGWHARATMALEGARAQRLLMGPEDSLSQSYLSADGGSTFVPEEGGITGNTEGAGTGGLRLEWAEPGVDPGLGSTWGGASMASFVNTPGNTGYETNMAGTSNASDSHWGMGAGAGGGAVSPSLGSSSIGAIYGAEAASAAAAAGRDDGRNSGKAHTSIAEREGGNDGYEKRLDPVAGDVVYLDTKTGAASRARPVFFATPRLGTEGDGQGKGEAQGGSEVAAPSTPVEGLAPLEPGAGGWLKYLDEQSAAVYFYHPDSGATQWERPAEYYTPRDQEGRAGVGVPRGAVSAAEHGVGWGAGDDASRQGQALAGPGVGAWSRFVDESSGAPYYFNSSTGETTWDQPSDFATPIGAGAHTDAAHDSSSGASVLWQRHMDQTTGAEYFVNARSGVSTWEMPTEFVSPG